jgi:hypothetical protein
VWNSNLVVDQFMGQAEVLTGSGADNPFGEEAAPAERRLELWGRRGRAETKMGSLVVTIGGRRPEEAHMILQRHRGTLPPSDQAGHTSPSGYNTHSLRVATSVVFDFVC